MHPPKCPCGPCKAKRRKAHIRRYYAGLSRDKRNELSQRRRANSYGVGHEPYSRSEVIFTWNNSCIYCDNAGEHIEHITPLSRGGDDVRSNVAWACAECNLSKGAKTLAEWALTFPGVIDRESDGGNGTT